MQNKTDVKNMLTIVLATVCSGYDLPFLLPEKTPPKKTKTKKIEYCSSLGGMMLSVLTKCAVVCGESAVEAVDKSPMSTEIKTE